METWITAIWTLDRDEPTVIQNQIRVFSEPAQDPRTLSTQCRTRRTEHIIKGTRKERLERESLRENRIIAATELTQQISRPSMVSMDLRNKQSLDLYLYSVLLRWTESLGEDGHPRVFDSERNGDMQEPDRPVPGKRSYKEIMLESIDRIAFRVIRLQVDATPDAFGVRERLFCNRTWKEIEQRVGIVPRPRGISSKHSMGCGEDKSESDLWDTCQQANTNISEWCSMRWNTWFEKPGSKSPTPYVNRKRRSTEDETCIKAGRYTRHCRGIVLLSKCQEGRRLRVGRACEPDKSEHKNPEHTVEWWPNEAVELVNTYCEKDGQSRYLVEEYWQYGSDFLNEIATEGEPSDWSFDNLGTTVAECVERIYSTSLFDDGTPKFETGKSRQFFRKKRATDEDGWWFSNLLIGKRDNPSPPTDYTHIVGA